MSHKQILIFLCVLNIVIPGVEAAPRHLAPVAEGQGIPGPGCDDGLILDDGSFETGYGWVPSAEWGEYVQTFQLGSVHPVAIESVCVCWTRTQNDDSVSFDLEFFEDVEGVPADEPFVVVGSSVGEVPLWSDGRFAEIPVGLDAPLLAPGTYHIGVRWAPSVDRYFFVCADQSDPENPVPGFFRDDRSDGEWASVLEAGDPIFDGHTAMLIRVRPLAAPPAPGLGKAGAVAVCGMIALGGLWVLRRRGLS